MITVHFLKTRLIHRHSEWYQLEIDVVDSLGAIFVVEIENQW